MTHVGLASVPAGRLRQVLEPGRQVSFGHEANLRLGNPLFSVQFRDGAFFVRSRGRHVGTFASWTAASDAAFEILKNSPA